MRLRRGRCFDRRRRRTTSHARWLEPPGSRRPRERRFGASADATRFAVVVRRRHPRAIVRGEQDEWIVTRRMVRVPDAVHQNQSTAEGETAEHGEEQEQGAAWQDPCGNESGTDEAETANPGYRDAAHVDDRLPVSGHTHLQKRLSREYTPTSITAAAPARSRRRCLSVPASDSGMASRHGGCLRAGNRTSPAPAWRPGARDDRARRDG